MRDVIRGCVIPEKLNLHVSNVRVLTQHMLITLLVAVLVVRPEDRVD